MSELPSADVVNLDYFTAVDKARKFFTGAIRSSSYGLIALVLHVVETVTNIRRRVGFKRFAEQIDTSTSGGKLVSHVFGALAEFAGDLIGERTHVGLR